MVLDQIIQVGKECQLNFIQLPWRNHPDGLKAIGGGFGGYSTLVELVDVVEPDSHNSSDYQPVQGPAGKAAFYPGPLQVSGGDVTLVMAAVVDTGSRTRCAVWSRIMAA